MPSSTVRTMRSLNAPLARGDSACANFVSQDQFGVHLHVCPWCHTDLTDRIRAHLYGCAMLPLEVRRRAQVARDAARSLVKRSLELRDVADVAVREAEAAIQSLRETLRKVPTRIGTKRPGHQIRLLSYHVLPMHLQIGDRFSGDTGEWEVARRPHSTAGSKSVNASVRRVDQPAIGEAREDRTWVAHERVRVQRATDCEPHAQTGT